MITLNVKKKKTKDGERWEQEVPSRTPEGWEGGTSVWQMGANAKIHTYVEGGDFTLKLRYKSRQEVLSDVHSRETNGDSCVISRFYRQDEPRANPDQSQPPAQSWGEGTGASQAPPVRSPLCWSQLLGELSCFTMRKIRFFSPINSVSYTSEHR